MRRKEVEEAINNLKRDIDLAKDGEGFETEVLCDKCDLVTALYYIEELEKEKQQVLDDYQDLGKDLANNFTPNEVIREKIEELRKKHNNVFDSQTVLKELFGE